MAVVGYVYQAKLGDYWIPQEPRFADHYEEQLRNNNFDFRIFERDVEYRIDF